MAVKYSKLAPVNSAKIKYEADRTNKDFIREYISALENYLNDYDDDTYETKLKELKQELEQVE